MSLQCLKGYSSKQNSRFKLEEDSDLRYDFLDNYFINFT